MNKNYVIIILFNKKKNKLLLVKRNKEPYKNCWNGIGGKIKKNETPLEAAKRECIEETNIALEKTQTFSNTHIPRIRHD